jgi:hypothetical protein
MAQLKILSHLLLGERIFSQCSTSVRVQRASLHPEFAMVFGPRRAPLHLEFAIWLGSRRAPLHPGLRYSSPLVPRVRTNWKRSRQGGGGGVQKEGKGEKSHLSQNLDILTWQVGKKNTHQQTNWFWQFLPIWHFWQLALLFVFLFGKLCVLFFWCDVS